jgi:hypothetical protein
VTHLCVVFSKENGADNAAMWLGLAHKSQCSLSILSIFGYSNVSRSCIWIGAGRNNCTEKGKGQAY